MNAYNNMDSEDPTPTRVPTWHDDLECTPSMSEADSEAWLQSIKMKIDNLDRDKQLTNLSSETAHIARVEIGNERDALREMVTYQQKTIQDLSLELEEERSASSSAASETMSMMLRLQKEKAEIQLEFRQFKRYVEEKMVHDQHELSAMEDLLYKREMAIESLYAEVQAYRHKMRSFGIADFEIDGDEGGVMPHDYNADSIYDGNGEIDSFNYPPLRCNINQNVANAEPDKDVIGVDKYAFGDMPHGKDQLKDLENRINQLEKCPRENFPDEELPPSLDNVWEKVIVGQSSHKPTHSRGMSTDCPKSFVMNVRETGSDFESPSRELRSEYNGSEIGDETSEKVCTIIAENKPSYGISEENISSGGDVEDPYIKKLFTRLQALEADRESMRKTLNAMQTDKAQVVLLKQIAQQLCKEMPPVKRVPEKKQTLIRSFSFLFTWMLSFVFWRSKPHRTKYMFGLSARNAGLLMLVDKGPRVGRWRCLLSTQV